MASFYKSSRSNALFNELFVNYASQISKSSLKYGVQKTRLRSAEAEQIANEEEKENARKRRFAGEDCKEGPSRTAAQRKRREINTINAINDNQMGEEEEDDDDNDKKNSIWDEWKQFLNNPENTRRLMQLSSERHNVIWCGKLVRRRSGLPPELYAKLKEEVPSINVQEISPPTNCPWPTKNGLGGMSA
ncbi:hypothetical protein DFQ28_006751 [Apophysomyces sp. BC1034]|nr:hypothetical protein DFQ30_002143 [Apophysomyces sp. BC1015]KAG0176873.1 hypothetical protein DFQ29_005545 [Apophysomyces sp. BC1021]KAG0187182.1 hypothetical protein DFQ28_006751 [Apophysomyces sp. BC1034]